MDESESAMVIDPAKFKIGTKLKLIPAFNIDYYGRAKCEPTPATVISINRKHKFFRVEFDHGNGVKTREAYKYCEEGDLACNLRLCV